MIDFDKLLFQQSEQFFLIAGPCAVESERMCQEIAGHVKQITTTLGINYVFKASFRKANRSRLDSFTGIGDRRAIKIIEGIRDQFDLPVTTDVHSVADVELVAPIADIIQIPAFLCRQTELIVAAAKTGKIVNIKKGQFMSAAAMRFAVQKAVDSGNDQVILTERGNSFGYTDLVVDFKGMQEMQGFGVPVVLDCTHSLQRPNQPQGVTGGAPEYIETLSRAAISMGIDGLFLETHPNPAVAKSDGANMLKMSELGLLLERLVALRSLIKSFSSQSPK